MDYPDFVVDAVELDFDRTFVQFAKWVDAREHETVYRKPSPHPKGTVPVAKYDNLYDLLDLNVDGDDTSGLDKQALDAKVDQIRTDRDAMKDFLNGII